MKNIIGIRREDLNKKGEKRVAIVPELAKKIISKDYTILVQSQKESNSGEIKRACQDEKYIESGAIIKEDLSQADIIFGLKEVVLDNLIANKAYLFFSHTHKGQIKNRKLLAEMIKKGITLFDYELVTNDKGGRIITAFTYFAGYAGMIDTLWAYGKKIKSMGFEHPFQGVPQSIETEDLGLIRKMITEIGENISKEGTPMDLPPMINVILGDGKTSCGAQEIYDLLPVKEIQLQGLKKTFESGSRKAVYKLVLDIHEMFRLNSDGKAKHSDYEQWEVKKKKQLYFDNPSLFESNLEEILPFTSILMNCILWSPEFPMTISRDFMKQSWTKAKMPIAIGDITCDPEGSIQFSKETWIDNPVFLYNPETNESTDGVEGDGVVVMAVTNLPCEFSVDASAQFSEDISTDIWNLLEADFSDDASKSGLSRVWLDSCIMWRGELRPKYSYMADYL